ncbi:unnamed protein product [Rotaria magnacalcarata]|uniref:UBA domain-containing protein n=1 Tax=Rotaria magnacalcarata TaxID=392030 RepID=A0A8S3I9K9_9BILA|nr:unnamed protein product [Rotaria magnacalcarata]
MHHKTINILEIFIKKQINNLFFLIYFIDDNRRQQQQSAQSVTTAASSLTPSSFPEKDIREITKKGFTRERAIEELKSTDGDVTKALVTLITKSLTIYKQKD